MENLMITLNGYIVSQHSTAGVMPQRVMGKKQLSECVWAGP